MLKIFDYIIYMLLKMPKTSVIGAIGFLSLVQLFNVWTLLYFLFPVLFTLQMSLITWCVLNFSLVVIFDILNGGLKPLKTLKKINKHGEKWDNEPKKTKRLRSSLVVVYFLASFIAFMLVFAWQITL
jgi:hypothetical protein